MEKKISCCGTICSECGDQAKTLEENAADYDVQIENLKKYGE